MKRQNSYWLPSLPELTPGGNRFKYRGDICYQGSVIRRRMINTPFWHYGIVYGYDKRKTLWVIDNTTKGVRCVRFIEFTAINKFYYEIDPLLNPASSQGIIDRAIEYSQKSFFDFRTFNCEMFVNYCVNKKKESWQVAIPKFFLNLFLSASEIRAAQFRKNENQEEVMKKFDEIRGIVQIPRGKKI